MFLSLAEVGDIIIMSIALGFIFGDLFKREKKVVHEYDDDYDPIQQFRNRYEVGGINWEGMKFAMAVTAPAIILHEFGHKFAAMAFGYSATFNAAYVWLIIGVIMKLMKFPFIFFVPAYVSFSAPGPSFATALIAFMGPFVNLLIFVAAFLVLKLNDKLEKPKYRKYVPWLVLTKNINLFLFFFNMIPIGLFDGAKVVQGLMAGFGL
jgi:Zn-dependent protease